MTYGPYVSTQMAPGAVRWSWLTPEQLQEISSVESRRLQAANFQLQNGLQLQGFLTIPPPVLCSLLYMSGAAATVMDGNQRIRIDVTATQEPAINETEEKIDTLTPLLIKKKQEPDSGNELSSSSIDSHDSATISTEFSGEKNISMTNDFSFPHDKSPPCSAIQDLSHSMKEHDQTKAPGSRRNSMQEVTKENGIESCEDTPVQSEERKALEVELSKCIEEFRKIRIPVVFPNKKRHWQNELLRKYKL
ncbi:BTB/POZ domain-containing protein KCTD8-like [Dendropsophus ebraccatus]|uniref:BTB/POZ domain-containing protein KCTD8-like n=1 Tax=Dendropsophus ebraccatus TaxID=150705 RepID=UPI0038310BE8